MSILAAVVREDVSYAAVLREAGGLAGAASFQVLSLHPSPSDERESVSSPARQTERARKAIKRQIEADLRALDLNATVSVPVARLHNVGDEIVERACQAGASVIVIGTRGRRGLNRLFFGSVAERVVRHALCDVYVARPRTD